MIRRLTVLVLSALTWPGTIWAQAGANWRVDRNQVLITVGRDGSSSTDQDIALSLRAGSRAHQHVLTHDSDFEKVELAEAHLVVSSTQARTSLIVRESATPSSRVRRTEVVVPAADEDAVVSIRWKVRQFRAPIAGHFTFTSARTFHPSLPTRYTFKIAREVPLQFSALGYARSTRPEEEGHSVVQWDLSATQGAIAPPDQVNAYLTTPHVWASTFPDYVALGRAYADLQPDPAEVRDELAQIVAQQRFDATTSLGEKARKLTYWVATNIRFVDGDFVSSGFRPSPLREILRAGSGDCKDHVALLRALLESIGVESVPALIDLRPNYEVPEIALPQAFNHVILWIPRLGLHVDPSSPNVPFGSLPLSERDKVVLHTGGSPTLDRTPKAFAPTTLRASTTAVSRGGKSHRVARLTATGIFGMQLRQAQFGRTGDTTMKGTGSIRVVDSIDQDEYVVNGSDVLDDATDKRIRGIGFFQTPFSLARIASIAKAPPRFGPSVCFGAIIEETHSFEREHPLGEGSLPDDVEYVNGTVSYVARYRQIDNRISVFRRFANSKEGTICSPEEYWAMVMAARKVAEDLQTYAAP